MDSHQSLVAPNDYHHHQQQQQLQHPGNYLVPTTTTTNTTTTGAAHVNHYQYHINCHYQSYHTAGTSRLAATNNDYHQHQHHFHHQQPYDNQSSEVDSGNYYSTPASAVTFQHQNAHHTMGGQPTPTSSYHFPLDPTSQHQQQQPFAPQAPSRHYHQQPMDQQQQQQLIDNAGHYYSAPFATAYLHTSQTGASNELDQTNPNGRLDALNVSIESLKVANVSDRPRQLPQSMLSGSSQLAKSAPKSKRCHQQQPTTTGGRLVATTTANGGLGIIARRKNATRETTATLKDWLDEHGQNPYPTKAEKLMLSMITKMTLTQVSTWFANARRRMKKENRAGRWVATMTPTTGGATSSASANANLTTKLAKLKQQQQQSQRLLFADRHAQELATVTAAARRKPDDVFKGDPSHLVGVPINQNHRPTGSTSSSRDNSPPISTTTTSI